MSSILVLISLSVSQLMAEPLRTNEFLVYNAPRWMKRVKLEKLSDSIQTKLEWSTRRVPIFYHQDQAHFNKAHNLGVGPVAVTIKSPQKTEIHLSPQVTKHNYQRVIGHELVHVIFYQKYRGAIPRWLEEGFANHLSRKTKVNYKWLKKQRLPKDVTSLDHPFKNGTMIPRVHYQVSQALVEMLKKKCDLDNLLRLSVKRKMENYIASYCNIKDVNKAFKLWLQKKPG